ncbi:hypothetical protein HK405_002429 [Cladochytrium tenue]|nr:hypothetical protein HK405_002429 [Cladochytrium tenue]
MAPIKTIQMRALIFTKEAGIIIGKHGKNVADIREQSGARVTVSENVPGAMERVLTISGPIDAVAKAFSLVATKFVEEQQTTQDVSARHTSVRLLVPHSQMGSVIGKQGSKIKEFQELSGAKIVAAEDMLPNSTERTFTINGVIASIHIATFHVGNTLLEHADRAAGTIFYKPIPGIPNASVASLGGLMGAGMRGGMPGMGGMMGAMGYGAAAGGFGGPSQAYGGYGGAPGTGGMRTPGAGGNAPGMAGGLPSANQMQQQIFIPR